MRLVLQEARRGQQRAGEQDRCPHTYGTFCSRNLLDSHHCGRFRRATEESCGITGEEAWSCHRLYIPRKTKAAETKG